MKTLQVVKFRLLKADVVSAEEGAAKRATLLAEIKIIIISHDQTYHQTESMQRTTLCASGNPPRADCCSQRKLKYKACFWKHIQIHRHRESATCCIWFTTSAVHQSEPLSQRLLYSEHDLQAERERVPHESGAVRRVYRARLSLRIICWSVHEIESVQCGYMQRTTLIAQRHHLNNFPFCWVWQSTQMNSPRVGLRINIS